MQGLKDYSGGVVKAFVFIFLILILHFHKQDYKTAFTIYLQAFQQVVVWLWLWMSPYLFLRSEYVFHSRVSQILVLLLPGLLTLGYFLILLQQPDATGDFRLFAGYWYRYTFTDIIIGVAGTCILDIGILAYTSSRRKKKIPTDTL